MVSVPLKVPLTKDDLPDVFYITLAKEPMQWVARIAKCRNSHIRVAQDGSAKVSDLSNINGDENFKGTLRYLNDGVWLMLDERIVNGAYPQLPELVAKQQVQQMKDAAEARRAIVNTDYANYLTLRSQAGGDPAKDVTESIWNGMRWSQQVEVINNLAQEIDRAQEPVADVSYARYRALAKALGGVEAVGTVESFWNSSSETARLRTINNMVVSLEARNKADDAMVTDTAYEHYVAMKTVVSTGSMQLSVEEWNRTGLSMKRNILTQLKEAMNKMDTNHVNQSWAAANRERYEGIRARILAHPLTGVAPPPAYDKLHVVRQIHAEVQALHISYEHFAACRMMLGADIGATRGKWDSSGTAERVVTIDHLLEKIAAALLDKPQSSEAGSW